MSEQRKRQASDDFLTQNDVDFLLAGVERFDIDELDRLNTLVELDRWLDKLALVAMRWHYHRQRGQTSETLRRELAQLACRCTLEAPFPVLEDDEQP